MTDSVALDSLRRSLQDWHDYWLVEAAFTLSRESRLLMLDLMQIPLSWNPVKRVSGDPERNKAIDEVIQHWLTAIQQRLVARACHELNHVLRGESAGRLLAVTQTIPQIHADPVADTLRQAALSAEWQQAVPPVAWAADGRSLILDQFWDPLLGRTISSILEKARGLQL